MSNQQLLTQHELAKRWRCSKRTLEGYRWRRAGPPFLKMMGNILYRLADIEAFEQASRVATVAKSEAQPPLPKTRA